MKELSIEEKAQRYDKALEAIKSLQEVNPSDEGIQNWVNENFPELNESEDEKILRHLKAVVKEYDMWTERGLSMNDVLAWLEKKGEQKPAWSEEDEEMLNSFLHKLEVCDLLSNKEGNWIVKKFKSLKYRVQPQPKQEWSEEDKKIIDRIESEFLALHRGDYKNIDFNDVDNLTVLNWVRKIKSIRFRNTWKPSDEQMKALNYVINLMASSERPTENDLYYNTLKSLREQLKKLKEE